MLEKIIEVLMKVTAALIVIAFICLLVISPCYACGLVPDEIWCHLFLSTMSLILVFMFLEGIS